MFYMADDAFRVGEYICQGLQRHRRGLQPAFGSPTSSSRPGLHSYLWHRSVENMSRDRVIDKFRITVGFNTDIEKARKLTKKIGAELKEDSELGPLFIEPPKMKGVEEFADYGICPELCYDHGARQTFIRRKARAGASRGVSGNDTAFAQPTVQVGGDDTRQQRGSGSAGDLRTTGGHSHDRDVERSPWPQSQGARLPPRDQHNIATGPRMRQPGSDPSARSVRGCSTGIKRTCFQNTTTQRRTAGRH